MNAWTVPGRINSSPRSVRFGLTVTTVGRTSTALSLAKELRAITRSISPQAARTTATVNKATRYGFILREGSDMSALRCLHGVCRLTSMNERKHRRHEEQGGNRGKDEAADDGAPQGCVLFAAVPEAQRHRNHADNHRGSGHQDRPDACESGLQRRLDRIVAGVHAFARK